MDTSALAASGHDAPEKIGPASAVEAVRSIIEKALGALCAALLTGMVAVVFANVVARYWLDAAIGWSEEVSRFMFIWVAFIGSVLAFRRGEHIGLDILVKALPRAAGHTVLLAGDLLVVASLVYLTKGGIEMTADSLASGWVSSAVPIPYGYVYLVVPVSFALMLVDGVLKMIADVRSTFAGSAGVKSC